MKCHNVTLFDQIMESIVVICSVSSLIILVLTDLINLLNPFC